ncbi:MAG: hypothetical protein WA793_03180 [Sphingorhabdus sp.]|uniref:hypothetical protein n=1 Tax=Sphingorhabdus sp. TaxID=1902408 RepID=UPI003C849808
MKTELKSEVDRNYDFFQRNLVGYLQEHQGQYALLKEQKLIGFYAGPGEAYRAGLAKFPDEIFSCQKVTDQVDDLGLFSIAIA